MADPVQLRPKTCSDEEWAVRVDLAALYRLFVRYGWTDLIYTHIAARVPGEPEHYLINPFGLMFDEITASNLIKVHFDGTVVAGDYETNEAGHLIHSAVLQARPDANFSLHTHSRAGIAVSCMKEGLLPLSQHANLVGALLGYHDYQNVTDAKDECEALARDLADPATWILILRNHGLLTIGRTAGEAFELLYMTEMSCKVQVDVLASGRDFIVPSADAIESVQQWGRITPDKAPDDRAWPALIRMLDRTQPDYKT